MGECKGLVSETAMVGVKTRARAGLAMAETSSPTKKIKKTTSYNLSVPENFVIDNDSTEAMVVEVDKNDNDYETANCSSSEVITCTTTTSSDFQPSCCSSNDNDENEIDDQLSKSDVVKDRLIADPEVENGEASSRYNDCHRTTRRREEKEEVREEATKSNGEDYSLATKLPDMKSTVQIKMMPSDAEIEEFFSAAEKDLHKRFIDKYNFDIVKDVPLEGRYEWVQINP